MLVNGPGVVVQCCTIRSGLFQALLCRGSSNLDIGPGCRQLALYRGFYTTRVLLEGYLEVQGTAIAPTAGPMVTISSENEAVIKNFKVFRV